MTAITTPFGHFEWAVLPWQRRLSEEDRQCTAITTPFGHFKWAVLPQGMSNSPSIFMVLGRMSFKAWNPSC